jgi:hypothetical protein
VKVKIGPSAAQLENKFELHPEGGPLKLLDRGFRYPHITRRCDRDATVISVYA